ncbi:MAG TPA: hypothetical protein VGV59_15875 [Pyrinomonadaceae bacterium]|nr:hypothetical protein [Pyrinomonadaceae bacterium]
MEIDKEKVVTQEESGEQAAVDQVEERVEAEMKVIEGKAKERVAQGMGDRALEAEAQKLKEEGQRELDRQQQDETENRTD